ncbi:unnamed protein product [Commensalibacter communis]|uniref:hypothetical protein n=1 Tax=Commensalibacter communis TaxID=2972786 RepID=UPI0022FF644C|nr:hypothetical protein [Commensalibacter communis]CAI3922860.1 unnamed protein product [Commensalibacter communis]CAI3936608.1 unnamed protein product [Commensalibacter communis]
MWKILETIGTKGSENGDIILEEESYLGARITLEKCKKYYTITAGIYGTMVHTVFCDEKSCQKQYQAMKKDIQEFLEQDTVETEALQFCEYFTRKY